MRFLPSTYRARLLIGCLLVFAALADGACTQANVATGNGGSDGGGNAGGKGGGANAGGTNAGAGGALVVILDAGPVDACVPTVTPAMCTGAGGPYCGLIGDNCNGQIDCGNQCPAGWICDTTAHVCVGGSDCKPTFQCTYAAGSTSGSYCGNISDGCNHTLACGDTCASLKAGWVCENNACVGSASV